jgi:hypothetical protein
VPALDRYAEAVRRDLRNDVLDALYSVERSLNECLNERRSRGYDPDRWIDGRAVLALVPAEQMAII